MNGEVARVRHWLGLGLLLGGHLVACQNPDENPVGPICPKCGPSTGGETGDFGPLSSSPCEFFLVPVPIDESEAAALGFDVPALKRRALRAFDVPMRWEPIHDAERDESSSSDIPVSGYEVATRIRATFSTSHLLHHLRPDPARCDGTTCRYPDAEATLPQASCRLNKLELEVVVEIETADRAVRATTRGSAVAALWQGADPFGESQTMYFNTSTDLRDATGRLRFGSPTSGVPYRGRLTLGGWLRPDGIDGNLFIDLEVDEGEEPELAVQAWEGEYYFPLHGTFPSAIGPMLSR